MAADTGHADMPVELGSVVVNQGAYAPAETFNDTSDLVTWPYRGAEGKGCWLVYTVTWLL